MQQWADYLDKLKAGAEVLPLYGHLYPAAVNALNSNFPAGIRAPWRHHSDAREIPIGVIGEATLDHVLVIGAAMRPSLTAEDLDALGPAARKFFANPMDSFWPEIEGVFNSAEAGQALNEFARRHTLIVG
jgi:hypothetical protein